jgi:hypothetical protein
MQPLEVESNVNPPPHYFAKRNPNDFDINQPLNPADQDEAQHAEKKITVDDIVRAIPFGRF